ncbi:sigma-70 family RNA polymerase sigma factor [Gracilibacillus timonensis]|uniref:sigma-70 family RNA polymerase sigma factor n=1 Tax=Gracilibacillus timonensis TaxID=1816696 RepID=UPI000825E189|nr:sigma-70 family RNA polymerase sigma factor [Gracilibacillus timonensis]
MQYEEALIEHGRIIYHLIHKYQIRDVEGEFYQEGLIALWHAVQSYDETKSKFSTYAYSCVSRRLINKMKKENREREQLENWQQQTTMADVTTQDDEPLDQALLREARRRLSEKQWWWFVGYICQDRSVKDIAEEHQVSENAVKNWGKNARPKLQQLWQEAVIEGGR